MKAVKTIGLVTTLCVVAVAVAQGIRTTWPPTTGTQVVAEWYSDVPWHQKLGTYAGNQIDEPIMLPYAGLGAPVQQFCKERGMSEEDCMIELGVVNILGMYRIDTPYQNLDAPECKKGLDCIQVTLDLHSFWTRPEGAQIKLLPRAMGSEPQHGYKGVEYGGYVLTDGSVYAPQMPWYMAHYCDAGFPKGALDMQDPVCYADYFSPMNSGFNPMNITLLPEWPRRVAFSPQFTAPAPPTTNNHCAKEDDKGVQLTKCTIALAGFDLTELSPTVAGLQYSKYNNNLLGWFNHALVNFAGHNYQLLNQHKFPWAGTQGMGAPTQLKWEIDIHRRASLNPFLGQFTPRDTEPAKPPHDPPCDVGPNGANYPDCIQTVQQRAFQHVYPRQCKLDDLAGGAPDPATVAKLRQCGLNYEIHHNGFMEQWPKELWDTVIAGNLQANQYGRTSFLFAGIPGMQLPASFYKEPGPDSLTDFEKVHNASIFSLFLPMANVADDNMANVFSDRVYKDKEWFHVLLMSNHMEANPEHFLDGIRGKVLWHNEYRTDAQFTNPALQPINPARWFAAAFKTTEATAPYHGNTCDSCHVRNGSGIPINTEGKLDKVLQDYMTDGAYNAYPNSDYTFTGQIRPMKLVFFDLKRDTARLDGSRYSEPLAFSPQQIKNAPRTMGADDFYYSNKIMNYYGDSFHLRAGINDFKWSYTNAVKERLVVADARVNAELNRTYVPQQIAVRDLKTGPCSLVTPSPTTKPVWPTRCDEVDANALLASFQGPSPEVGYMLLNGKRLGNLAAIESIPSKAIEGFRKSQSALLGDKIAGEIIWNAGARDGIDRPDSKIFRTCRTKSTEDCFIGRFGWLGDRVSLEDQVANAAFVEMNMTTSEGYHKLYASDRVAFPIRYAYPNCGPANKGCMQTKANKDLTERDIDRMADYARWVGNPTRSELKVSLPDVVAGEKIFKTLKCDTCHVIQKIKIDPDDTMLTANYRERLKKHVSASNNPFLSYIGTDLLMHDMGYLSQVGFATESIRDPNDGVVLPQYQNFVQKIRTPALKGLRFNRFVTDAHKNTKPASNGQQNPACDFLLHDGRACDAVEAAFLHDGPAVRKLGVVTGLNALTASQVMQLRAFLYSL